MSTVIALDLNKTHLRITMEDAGQSEGASLTSLYAAALLSDVNEAQPAKPASQPLSSQPAEAPPIRHYPGVTERTCSYCC